MYYNLAKLPVALLSVFMITGCATIFSGGSTDVQIRSEPEDASVYLDGIQRGASTPTVLNLDHSYSDVWNDKRVTLRLEGYDDRTFKIDHGISGWYWANALVGIGGAVASYLTIGGTSTTESYDDFESASDDAATAALISSASGLAGAGGAIIDLVTGSWVSVDKTRYRIELREGVSNVGSHQRNTSYADYSHLSLDELEREEDGAYVIPEHEKPLAIYDTESNMTIVFRSE